MIKSIKYFFEAIFIYFFFLIARLFGLKISRKLFSFIFKFIGPAIRTNKIIDKNLLEFSSNLSIKEKEKITSNMWESYGKTFVEYLFLKKFRINSSHISITGEDILNKILMKNKPVIFVSGHFANFELMSMEITKKRIKLATIYRPLNNFFLNPFMEYLRRKYICKNQIKKGIKGVKDITNYLKEGFSIALMIDQRVSEGKRIRFFQKDALTTTLPAQLAIKYKLDIVPVFIERNEKDFFHMKVFDPIKASESQDKQKISLRLNQFIESMIRRNPNQWIWTHNRWK